MTGGGLRRCCDPSSLCCCLTARFLHHNSLTQSSGPLSSPLPFSPACGEATTSRSRQSGSVEDFGVGSLPALFFSGIKVALIEDAEAV